MKAWLGSLLRCPLRLWRERVVRHCLCPRALLLLATICRGNAGLRLLRRTCARQSRPNTGVLVFSQSLSTIQTRATSIPIACGHILSLLRRLKMPLVTTLHTVLREPDLDQQAVLEEIAHLSDRLIVMSELASTLLRSVYGVPTGKIDLIPHGVPDFAFTDPNYFKDLFSIQGKPVLLTFGLLSPNKGIENVIRALPAILAKHNNVTYIVSGATHPHIRRREGERYREGLQQLAIELGVSSHVIFNNRFVSAEELVEHVGAADIYITPYRQEAQIVSGTLAIALGAGKAIISTPYWHAQELLADGRGILVPFDDPASIAAATNRLLDNDAERHTMRKRAYLHSRGTTWQRTAQAYMGSFQRARTERILRPRPSPQDVLAARSTDELPALDAAHLKHMTDDTGILQHAVFSVPNCAEGYTTDDNARALIVSVLLQESSAIDSDQLVNLSRRYLAFLEFAFHGKVGRFRNFLGYDRQWRESAGSEDSHGRALWASCSSPLFRPLSPSLVRAHGRFLFWVCRDILTGSRETGSFRGLAICWQTGCWTYMSALTLRAGSGSRRASRIPTHACRRRLFWLDGTVKTGEWSMWGVSL